MGTMAPRCSIIIRCYNEAAHLDKLLCGIKQQTMRDVQVVAVDSGSTDESLCILQQHGVRTVCIKPSEFSFGRSCNIGCRAAAGEFLVFISAHAYPVYTNWLEELLRPFKTPAVAVSYGKQRGGEKNAFSDQQIFKAWYPEEGPGIQGHPFCNNANCAVRRSVWEALSYDESLTGLEDLDFAKRAQDVGHAIAYAAAAEIIHVHQETASMVRNRYRREAIAYRHIYPHARISLAKSVALYCTNVLSDCRQALKEGVLRRHAAGIFKFRLMQFVGAWQGMRQHRPVSSDLMRRFYYPPKQASHLHSAKSTSQACAVNYAESFHD